MKGLSTRPTSDRVKGSLFNIISCAIHGADILDLYAGTGNLGIEALSRGANFAVFVDRSTQCSMIIKENLIHTKLDDRAEVLTGEVCWSLSRLSREDRKFDIIFLDPPYNKKLVEDTLWCIIENNTIKSGGIVIAEHDFDDNVPEEAGILKKIRSTKYGDTIISFYRSVQ